MWPHLQSQEKAPWGRGCVWHPRKSQEQNALIPAQYWYKLGIRVDTRSHRLNSATSFPGLFPFPGNEVGPSGYQWITPFKGIQIPESRKYLPEESGILSSGIWNTAQNESGIPLTIGIHGQNQSHLAKNSETTSWNPSRIQDCLEFPYMGWSRVL